MRKLMTAIVLLLAVVVLATSCVSPKVLASYSSNGDKPMMLVLQRANVTDTATPNAGAVSGENVNPELFNFLIRICDYDAGNQLTNCKDTLVIPNVYPQSVY